MRKVIPTIITIALLAGCAKVTQEGAPCTGPLPPAPVVQNVVLLQGYSTEIQAITSQQYTSINWRGPNNFSSNTQDGQLLLDFSSTTNYGLYTASAFVNGCSSKPDTFYVTQNPIVVPPPCTITPANYNSLVLSTGPVVKFYPGQYVGSTLYNCSGASYYIEAVSTDGVYTFDLYTYSQPSSGINLSLVSNCYYLGSSTQAFATISSGGSVIYQSVSGLVYLNTIGAGTYITFCGANFQNASSLSSLTISGNVAY